MTESMAKRKAKGTLRASKPRKSATKSKSPPKAGTKAKPSASKATPVKLLTGGNPQIAKADGDAPVQAYIAAMPAWKRDVGRRLDALIVRNVPSVRGGVRIGPETGRERPARLVAHLRSEPFERGGAPHGTQIRIATAFFTALLGVHSWHDAGA